jgi:alcohol dehydrogenase (NADP+)
VNAFTLIANGIKLGGSAIGAPGEIEEMLKLAADQKVKPWIQERPLKDANQVVVDLEAGKARYKEVSISSDYSSVLRINLSGPERVDDRRADDRRVDE